RGGVLADLHPGVARARHIARVLADVRRARSVHRAHQLDVERRLGEPHDGAPHAPPRPEDGELHDRGSRSSAASASRMRARVASEAATRGSRTSAFIIPSMLRAALAGAGFGSRNIAPCSGKSDRCAARASSHAPFSAWVVTADTSAGSTLELT